MSWRLRSNCKTWEGPQARVEIVEALNTEIRQGECCEQGDALGTALYVFGQLETLWSAAPALHEGDLFMAVLDGMYIVTAADRARGTLASNLGKTHIIAAEAGLPPPGIAELGADVAKGQAAGPAWG
eukprot:s5401_g2.t1